MTCKRCILMLIVLTLSGSLLAQVNFSSLVEEMTDLDRLADFSTANYKTVQYSSYDRRSDTPNGPGWYENSDGFGGEPIPGFEAVIREPDKDGIGQYLVCDIKGPGALVRFWAADSAVKGQVEMYIDGSDEPVFDGKGLDFFHNTASWYARKNGIDEALFKGTFEQRDAVYFPIPFARSCRVVYTGNTKDMHFYHLQARLYGPGTKVESFKPDDIKTNLDLIEKTAAVLRSPSQNYKYDSDKAESFSETAEPGTNKLIWEAKGGGMIEKLTLKLDSTDTYESLRNTLLYIRFDDYVIPQVQSPVGDFFGSGPGIVPYDSLPFTVDGDGTMTCRLPMPFESSAKIYIHNLGSRDVEITGGLLLKDIEWDSDMQHFYARWRVDHDLISNDPSLRDLPFLCARGRGRYVGTSVVVNNPNPIPGFGGCWWGEGDEKVFVDDDRLPSIFGTGSEDYFNYSWCSTQLFEYAYAAQPRVDGPGNRGFTNNIRWHIFDDIPFNNNIFFYIELLTHERTEGISYARQSYFYGNDIVDDHISITPADTVRPVIKPWKPEARFNFSNTEFLQAEHIAAAKGGDITIESDPLWAGGELVCFNPKTEDDALKLRFSVEKAGEYRIYIAAKHSRYSGTLTASVESKTLIMDGKEQVNLFLDSTVSSRVLRPEPVTLFSGEHTITFKGKGGEIGIDFIGLQLLRRIPDASQPFIPFQEAEGMKVTSTSESLAYSLQSDEGLGVDFSGDAHLWIRFTEPGQWLDMDILSNVSGSYSGEIQLTKAADYGIVEIYFNGDKLTQADCYVTTGIKTQIIRLEKMHFNKGNNTMKIKVKNKNPDSAGYFAGFDYLKINENPL
ncbi:DUF2961 domain-containing protein [Limihaloglobus sulfuriphilus]|nr:DUF2961 domain-containing protein [Limihaloglobus sulfuriphilus]